MQRILLLTVCLVFCAGACATASGAPVTVLPGESKAWCRYLVPLPKSVEITGKVALSPAEIAVVPPAGAVRVPSIVDEACKELKQATGQEDSQESSNQATFKVEMILGGPDAEKLKALKNSEQAYSIAPSDSGLKLVALTPRGLYYASKTLQQLIRAHSASYNVEMPVLTVTDWPDLQDRGLWGGDSGMHIDWLSERKMNVIENISTRSVDKQGRGHSGPKDFWTDALTEGPIRGVNVVPAVLHLEQVARPYSEGQPGLFDIYPNLKAKGSEGGAICYSQPQFVNVLADWIVDLKSLPGVTEVSIWLAENLHGKGGCKCAECMKTDRNVLETRTILAAWKKAEERLGIKFPIRILTSEETRASTKLVLKELPPEVKVSYYDSMLTYTNGKEPMVSHDYDEFIKNGGWVAVVPNISAFVHLPHPFTSPQFSHYRLNDFVDNGVSGLLGYSCTGLMNNRFLVEGAADWAWNAKGRTPHEFAVSWAVRQGLKDPETFAAWTDIHGPVAWDVYGSDFPYSERRGFPGPLATRIQNGTLPPLGTVKGAQRGPWGQIKTIKQFDDDVATEHRALQMAQEMGIPEFYYESLVVDGYIRALRAAYDIGKLMPKGKIPAGKKPAVAKLFKTCIDCLRQSTAALPKWEGAISGQEPESTASVEFVNLSIDKLEKLAADLGLDLNKA